MTARDATIAMLAERLANGDDIGKRSLFDVLQTQAEWCDLADYLVFLHGDPEQVDNIRARHRERNEALAGAWLETSARWLVDERCEGEDVEEQRSAA